MFDRVIFDGCLAHDTAEAIAEAMRSVLDGQEYTFVAVNELFGYRPEVRVGLTLREPIEVRSDDDSGLVWVRFNDQNYVCSIDTRALTQADARTLPEESLDKVRVTVSRGQVQIEHRVPVGGKLWWTLAVTAPSHAEIASR